MAVTYKDLMTGNALTGYGDKQYFSAALNDNNDAAAGVFQAPYDGVIDRVLIQVQSIIGTSPVYDCRLVELDVEDLTDTLKDTNTNKTFTPTAGLNTVTLTSSYTVAAGEMLAVRMHYSSGTVDNSNYASVAYYATTADNPQVPCGAFSSGISFMDNRGTAGMVPMYSDGVIMPGSFLSSSAVPTVVNFDSGTNPDEYGIAFTPTVDVTCVGFFGAIQPTSQTGADVKVILYDGTTELQSVTLSDNDWFGTTGDYTYGYFTANQVLTASTEYIIAVQPQTAAHTWAIYTLDSESYTAGMVQGAYGDYHRVDRVNSGSWTADTTDTVHLWPLLEFDQLPAAGNLRPIQPIGTTVTDTPVTWKLAPSY